MSSNNNLRTVYTDPPTFMDTLLECSRFIDQARRDPISTKEDVLDSMETRLSLLVGKLASQPTSASFAIHFPLGEHGRGAGPVLACSQ